MTTANVRSSSSLLRYWNNFGYCNNSNVNRRLGHVVIVIAIMSLYIYVVESAKMNLHSERNYNGSQDITTMAITRNLNKNNDINYHQSKQIVNLKRRLSLLRKGTRSSSSSSTSLSRGSSNQKRYYDTPMIRINKKLSQQEQNIRIIKEDKDNQVEEVDDYYIEDNEQGNSATQEPSQNNQEQDDDVTITQSPQDEEVDTTQENTENSSPTSTPATTNNVNTNDNDATTTDNDMTTNSTTNTKNQIDICKDIVTNGIYNTTSTTNNPITIKYEYEVSTTITELQMTSISKAVQYYLVDTYMKPTCEDLLGNDKRKFRLMQDNFASYVSGVDAGNSILMSLPCSLSSEPSSSSSNCQRHQSINVLYVDNEYNSNTDDEWNRIRYAILYDLSSSFKDGTIISYYDLVRMDNPSLPQLTSIVYVYGTSGTISIPTNGDSSNGDVSAAQGQVQPKNKDGLNGGLIFFFVLFILILCILFTLVLLRKYKPQTFETIKESTKKHSINAIDKSKDVASTTYQKVKEKYYNYQAERNMKHMNNTNQQHDREMDNNHDDDNDDRDDFKFQPNIIISPQKTHRTDNNSFNSGDYDDNDGGEYGLELILSDIEEQTNNSFLNNSASIYSRHNNNNTIMNDQDKNYSASFFEDDDAFMNPTYNNNNNNSISTSQNISNNTSKNNKQQQDPIGHNARSKSARYSAYNNRNMENIRNNEQEVQLSKYNNNDQEQKTYYNNDDDDTMNNIQQQKGTRTIPVEPINPNTVSPMHKKAMKFFEQRKLYGLAAANGGTPMRPTSHNKYLNNDNNNNTSSMTPQQQHNEHEQALSTTIPNQQQQPVSTAVTPNKWTAATTRHLKQLAQNYYRLRSENSNNQNDNNDNKQRYTPETLPYDDEIPIAMINNSNTIDNSFYCATNEDTHDFTLLSDVHVIVDDTSTHYTMDSSAIFFDKNNNLIDDFDDDDDDDDDSEQVIHIPPRKTSVPDTVDL